jgi:hypothetical protein
MHLASAGILRGRIVSWLRCHKSFAISAFLDFKPTAVMFAPHQRDQIILSDIGILIWLAALATWTYYRGFAEVFTLYLVPYLWFVVPISGYCTNVYRILGSTIGLFSSPSCNTRTPFFLTTVPQNSPSLAVPWPL